jgi:hypothetical protein
MRANVTAKPDYRRPAAAIDAKKADGMQPFFLPAVYVEPQLRRRFFACSQADPPEEHS